VKRSMALLATTSLFLMGIAVGVLATHAFYAWQIHRPGGLASLGLRLLGGSLERELDLSAAQERQVDAILAETRVEMQQVRHDVVPRLFAIRARAFERIAGVLTPEQQEDLRRFRSRHESNVNRLVGDW
jgi:Spy/CpxP family protein refolding chaperone